MWWVFLLVKQYLKGVIVSFLYEVWLIYEEMGVWVYIYLLVYILGELEEILKYSSYFIFNLVVEYEWYIGYLVKVGYKVFVGLCVNLEYFEVEMDFYNLAVFGFCLGIVLDGLGECLLEGVEGLYFYIFCELSFFDLEKVLVVFEYYFGCFFLQLKWVNFGGGYLMMWQGYDIFYFIQLL